MDGNKVKVDRDLIRRFQQMGQDSYLRAYHAAKKATLRRQAEALANQDRATRLKIVR